MRKRSPNGMPRPYRRADGRWQTNVELPRKNGKRRRKPLYGRTEAEVRDAWLEFQRAAASQPSATASGDMTFESFARRMLQQREGTRAPSTVARDESMLRVHVFPYIGASKLNEVTHESIVEVLNIAKASIGATTRRHLHGTMKKYFEMARKRRIISESPVEFVDRPRASTPKAKRLTGAEVSRYMQAIKGDAFEAAFLLAILSGMRQGEILGLRWANVDLQQQKIDVATSLALGPNGTSRLGPTKTVSSTRTIAINGEIVDALTRRKTAQAKSRLLAGPEWNQKVSHLDDFIANDLVFTNEMGFSLSRTNFTRTHHGKIIRKAGVRSITFHELRHTFVSLHHDIGTKVEVVQTVVGHASPEMTKGVYTHSDEDIELAIQREAMDLLVAHLGRPTGRMEDSNKDVNFATR